MLMCVNYGIAILIDRENQEFGGLTKEPTMYEYHNKFCSKTPFKQIYIESV